MTGAGAACAGTRRDAPPDGPASGHASPPAGGHLSSRASGHPRSRAGGYPAPPAPRRGGSAAGPVARDLAATRTTRSWLVPPPVEAYVLHARDAASLAATACRIAELAPSLSDAELRDLACQLGRDGCPPGGFRAELAGKIAQLGVDRKSTRLNSSHT